VCYPRGRGRKFQSLETHIKTLGGYFGGAARKGEGGTILPGADVKSFKIIGGRSIQGEKFGRGKGGL